MSEQHFHTFLSLPLSHILSLQSQSSCSTPLRPPSSSTRRSVNEGSGTCLSKTDHFHLSPKSGRENLNVEARISKLVHSSASSSRHSPEKNKKEGKHCTPKVSENSRYQQPTVSSTIRALSPYTHRKMCQLSEDAQQRLSHLELGPHHFRKETESQRPFLVGNIRCIPPWHLHKTSYDALFIPVIHMFSGSKLTGS